jgi:hypothetical protein
MTDSVMNEDVWAGQPNLQSAYQAVEDLTTALEGLAAALHSLLAEHTEDQA